MAARYFLNIGTDWGNTANWSDTDGGTGGFSVPTTTDDVFFTALSGNCTVNASARVCKTLNFTGYTNTITMSQNITVSGNVTLVAAMTIAGAGELWIDATATLTSNGKTWPNMLWPRAAGSITITLADNWIVGDLNLSVSAGTVTLNGNSITTNSNALVQSTSNGVQGTTVIVMAGTGTIGTFASSNFYLPVQFNSAGTITFNTNFNHGAELNNIAGTIVTTGSTYRLQAYSSRSITSNGILYNNVIFGNTTGFVVTLTDNMTVNGTLQLAPSNSNNYVINGSSLIINSNFSVQSSNGQVLGTTNFIYTGTTGAWTSLGGSIRNNLTIASGATLTLGSNVIYGTGTLTVDAAATVTPGLNGLILDTGTTLNIGNTTQWYSIFPRGASATITLLSDIYSDFLNVTFNGVTFIGAYNIYCKNLIGTGVNTVVSTTGTKVVLNPDTTGTWSLLGPIRCDVDINCTGTLTISGIVGIFNTNGATASKTFRRVAGTVITTGSTFNIDGNWILDTNTINFNIFNIKGVSSTQTFQLDSLLTANRIQHTGPMDNRFTGAFGWTTNEFFATYNTPASPIFRLTAGNTYAINTSMVTTGAVGRIVSFLSLTSSSYAYLNLNASATQNVTFTNATDIDSSGGQTIRTTPGMTLTRTINWAYKASSNFFFFFQ